MSDRASKAAAAKLHDWRVQGPVRLSRIDPGATPFLGHDRAKGEAELARVAAEIDRLQDLLYANGQAPAAHGAGRSLLLVLQGMDTSGKDGTARGVFSACSPLGVRVTAFKAPTEAERAHDFLWRVHAVVPRAGELVVFNRSHYEDVLVPLVEGQLDKAAAKGRYAEINAFEAMLVRQGTAVLKCCLHISKDEQRARLQARLDHPAKRWKFQPGDLAVRARWDDYRRAYDAALAATSTDAAPWYVVPANNKLHRNLMVATLVESALRRMDLTAPLPDFDPSTMRIPPD